MADGIRLYDHGQQLELVSESLHDERRSVPTGFAGLDLLLRRGGLLPGNLVVLGGRTGTRKSTVIANMMVSMARRGVPVGLVGLDEQPWQYVVSLLSVWTGHSRSWVEERWDEPEGRTLRADWKDFARGLVHLFGGQRPGVDHLSQATKMADLGDSNAPAVVFVDYLNKLSRSGQYGYAEVSRVPRLVEDLGIWTTESGNIVVALHQLGRNDEYGQSNNRNAGHVPVTLAQLKYGGEEDADLVIGTYRPAMNPLAEMDISVAKQTLGPAFDEDVYYEIRGIAKRLENSTFLQLLKNRPGEHRELRGIELLSAYGDSLLMTEREGKEEHDGQAERERDRRGVQPGGTV